MICSSLIGALGTEMTRWAHTTTLSRCQSEDMSIRTGRTRRTNPVFTVMTLVVVVNETNIILSKEKGNDNKFNK